MLPEFALVVCNVYLPILVQQFTRIGTLFLKFCKYALSIVLTILDY